MTRIFHILISGFYCTVWYTFSDTWDNKKLLKAFLCYHISAKPARRATLSGDGDREQGERVRD
jgi:hypothetical protein